MSSSSATTKLGVRLRSAMPAVALHFLVSSSVALSAAALVWGVWYPSPYDAISGGRDLFTLIVIADIVCGPMLTLVVFDKLKPRVELIRDLSVVTAFQISALIYGLSSVYVARPLYLVHEVDRFKVISEPDYLGADVSNEMARLPPELTPSSFRSPRLVGAQLPQTLEEQTAILFEAMQGGRDMAQRPELYVAYDEEYANRAATRAKPISRFLERFPSATERVEVVLRKARVSLNDAFFLPLAHRQQWIVLIDKQGRIIGFVPGDGFAV